MSAVTVSQMKQLLEMYSARGMRLEDIAVPKIMGRKVATLKKYCRRFGIAFVDYKPRPAKEQPPNKKDALRWIAENGWEHASKDEFPEWVIDLAPEAVDEFFQERAEWAAHMRTERVP